MSAIIFIAALAAAGGLYLYRVLLSRDISELSQSITRAEEIISPSLVARLSEYDKRVAAVKTLLGNHIVLSPVFEILEELVISSVRFSEFEYKFGRDVNAKVVLSGEARSYSALAAQADLLGKSEHINNPIFSNFELNPQGNVTFNFTTDISKNVQLYRNTLPEEIIPQESAPTSPVESPVESEGTTTPPE